MAYKEYHIRPWAKGFGQYEAEESDGIAWDDERDLVGAIRRGIAPADLYELGVDGLPDGIEDIRGRIYGEPARIFAWLDEHGRAQYFGIVQV